MNVPGVLQHRSFRNLLFGQAVSALGDWMATVALMALVLQVSGSPAAVGGILAIRLMPSIFAGPIAAGIALRYDRRRTMLAMDLIRAPMVAVIPLVGELWWIYTFAFLSHVGELIFLPARDAAVPDLVNRREVEVANGFVLVSSYGNIPLGAGAFAAIAGASEFAGGFVAQNPFVVVFAIDAITFLVSYWFIRRITIPGEAAPEEKEGGLDLGAFFRALRLPILRAILPALVAIVAGVGALFSLGIVYVENVLEASQIEFGVLIVMFGVGASAAVVWLHLREKGTTIRIVRVGVAAMGALLATMSLLSNLAASLSVAAVFGFFAAVALVGAITFLQRELEGKDRILALTTFHIVFRFGASVAALGTGFAAQRISPWRVPVLGELAPSTIVLFWAGVAVMVGGFAIRPKAVREAVD